MQRLNTIRRIEETGEEWEVARAAVLAGQLLPQRLTDAEVVAEYGEHLGIPLSSVEVER